MDLPFAARDVRANPASLGVAPVTLAGRDLLDLVALWADLHGLPRALVAAIVTVESAGEPWAWNPEPRYRYLWDVKRGAPFRDLAPDEIASSAPPRDFPTLAGDPDQEWWAQRASWGLMQVMGAVARERGFRGPWLPAILEVPMNLDLGCRHLAGLRQRFFDQYGWGGVINAYNAGGPYLREDGRWSQQPYVDRVQAAWARLQEAGA